VRAITLLLADLTGKDSLVPAAAQRKRQVPALAGVHRCQHLSDFTTLTIPRRFVSVNTAAIRSAPPPTPMPSGCGTDRAKAGSPWFLGERFSALDIYFGVMTPGGPSARAGRNRDAAPLRHRPAHDQVPELTGVWKRNWAGQLRPPCSVARSSLAIAPLPLLRSARQLSDKPITMVVRRRRRAGGTDLIARLYFRPLVEELGPAIIDHKKAGGNAIGTATSPAHSRRLPPLLMQYLGLPSANPALIKELNGSPMMCAGVAMAAAGAAAFIVTARKSRPTTSSLIAYAKANPGQAQLASVGKARAACWRWLRTTGRHRSTQCPTSAGPATA